MSLTLDGTVGGSFPAGSVSAPSLYLSSDTTTGLYRIGANNNGYAVSGVKLLDLGSALVGVTGALTVSTTLGVTGATTLSSTLAIGTTKKWFSFEDGTGAYFSTTAGGGGQDTAEGGEEAGHVGCPYCVVLMTQYQCRWYSGVKLFFVPLTQRRECLIFCRRI